MIIPISCQTPYCDIALWTEIWWTWTWKTRTGVNTFPAKYILRVNIFQDEYFSEVNLSQEWIYFRGWGNIFRGEYFSGVNILRKQISTKNFPPQNFPFVHHYFWGRVMCQLDIFPFEFRTVEHCLVWWESWPTCRWIRWPTWMMSCDAIKIQQMNRTTGEATAV